MQTSEIDSTSKKGGRVASRPRHFVRLLLVVIDVVVVVVRVMAVATLVLFITFIIINWSLPNCSPAPKAKLKDLLVLL